MLLLIFGLLSLVLSVLYVLVSAWWQTLLEQPERRSKMIKLSEEWRQKIKWL